MLKITEKEKEVNRCHDPNKTVDEMCIEWNFRQIIIVWAEYTLYMTHRGMNAFDAKIETIEKKKPMKIRTFCVE